MNIYNTHTYLNTSNYTLNPKRLLTEDIDFDGNQEVLIQDLQNTYIYTDTGELEFKKDPDFLPVPHAYPFKILQLDTTQSKELISYFRKDVWIYNGSTGVLERTLLGLTDGDVVDLTSFRDENEDFFLVLLSMQKVYVYNYTKGIMLKTFSYSSSGAEGRLKVFQMQVGQTLQNLICTFKTELKIFTPEGELLYESPFEKSIYNEPGQIVITDYDHDLKPNIITSSFFKFTEYKYTGAGEYHAPFYLTDLFPGNYATLRKITPFQFQFSEGVEPDELRSKLLIQSKRYGVLDFTVQQTGDHQLEVTPTVPGNQTDTITIQLRGSLLSKFKKQLDTNHDDISEGEYEKAIRATYYLDPDAPANILTISPLYPSPELIYSRSIRYFPFHLTTGTPNAFKVPITEVKYGLLKENDYGIHYAFPTDSIFDESQEEIKVPINAFKLKAGQYTIFLVSKDLSGEVSDTFFKPFEVIDETGYPARNKGASPQRTNQFENQTITSNLRLIGTLPHANSSDSLLCRGWRR